MTSTDQRAFTSSGSGNESVWRVTDFESIGSHGLVVQTAFKQLPASCPKCGSSRRPRRYGNLKSNYRDVPFLGRQVAISVDLQRFRCADCGQAFFQDLPGMADKRRMTARCASYVIDQVMVRSSLRDVAMIVGVDEKTVRNVFEDRGLIFSVGDPPSDDRFVCECCLGVLPKSDLRLPPPRHFGKWRKGRLRQDTNVCSTCFGFAADPWRFGIVRRFRAP